MTGHGTKYGHKKERVIAALLNSRHHEEAARLGGISLKTLKRWMRLPDFDADFLRARREVVAQTHARIQQHSGIAVTVMFKLLGDSTPSVKARAAQFIIEHSGKSLEQDDFGVRLAKLERDAEEAKRKQ